MASCSAIRTYASLVLPVAEPPERQRLAVHPRDVPRVDQCESAASVDEQPSEDEAPVEAAESAVALEEVATIHLGRPDPVTMSAQLRRSPGYWRFVTDGDSWAIADTRYPPFGAACWVWRRRL